MTGKYRAKQPESARGEKNSHVRTRTRPLGFAKLEQHLLVVNKHRNEPAMQMRKLIGSFILLWLIGSADLLAQSALPDESKTTSQQNIARDILVDQKAIWTSPAQIRQRDLKWIVPVSLSTAAMIATDSKSSGALRVSATRQDVSDGISRLGSPYSTFAGSAIIYGVGRWKHKERLQRTGFEGLEALADSSLFALATKAATNRQRPTTGDHEGSFWEGGASFPSAHAADSWTMASVIAHEYKRRWVAVAAYGTASAVSIARFTGRDHFLSDVLVGSTAGYLIGRFVVRRHNTEALQP